MDTAALAGKIEEVQTEIEGIDADLSSAINGALNLISGFWLPLPPGTYDRAKSAGDEAKRKWREEVTDPGIELAKAVERILNDYPVVKAAASQYCEVDFSYAQEKLGPQSLGAQAEDWTSANTELYLQTIDALPNKIANIKAGVDEICRILGLLEESYGNLGTDMLLALGGLIVGLIGLAATIAGIAIAVATAGPTIGVGAIVGIVMSVVGLVTGIVGVGFSIISAQRAADTFENARETATTDLKAATTNVQAQTWPRKPGMGADGWSG